MSDDVSSTTDLLEVLGIDPSIPRTSVLVDDLADRPVVYARAEAWVPDADLAGRIAESPFFEDLDTAGAPLSLARWERRKQVVVAELVGIRGSVSVAGAVRRDEGQLIFPAHERGMAGFATDAGTWILSVEVGGRIDLDRLGSAPIMVPVEPDVVGPNQSDGSVLPPFDAELPDPSLLPALNDVFTAEHLTALDPIVCDRVRGLEQSPSTLDRAEALGLTSRAWSPTSPQEVLKRVLAGEPTPAVALCAWAAQAPTVWLHEWQLQAVSEAMDLAVEEQDLGPPQREDHRLALAFRRDRLESTRVVLAAAGDAELLGAMLESFDAGRGAPIPGPALPDPQLRAILRNEPDAWWARLAAPALPADLED